METKKQKQVKISKPFWAFLKTHQTEAYAGGNSKTEYVIIQFDTPKELYDAMGEISVEAGESGGTYAYKELVISHPWVEINRLVLAQDNFKEGEVYNRDFARACGNEQEVN